MGRLKKATAPSPWCSTTPNPEADAGPRRGRIADADARRFCDVILRGASPRAAIAAVDEVHTLTSLIGFAALLHGRKVVTYGAPFYAGWGLTEDLIMLPRRSRRLSLDELVAGALILYPAYIDPVSGLACDAETVALRLAAGHRDRARWSLRGPWLRRLEGALRALVHTARPADDRRVTRGSA